MKVGADLALEVIKFAVECSTGVVKELKSYIEKLKINSFDFARIKKHTDFRDILTETSPNLTKRLYLECWNGFQRMQNSNNIAPNYYPK